MIISGPALLYNHRGDMNRDIYCSERLLDVIQNSGILQDCKTFVDMPMKENPDIIFEKFEELCSLHHGKPSKYDLEEFLNENFEQPGNELEEYTPLDWQESLSILQKLPDPIMRDWASELNGIWKSLTRKMKADVVEFPKRTSLLAVPYPFVVPGERFREIYYWDSYWIINGLLLCDMASTVKGILQNFIGLVKQYGFVPNGSRVYYTKRSQPPLLIPMVDTYYQHSQDLEFIGDSIEALSREYEFWMTKRSVEYTHPTTGKVYQLGVYGSESDTPRPEGYTQDLHQTSQCSQDKKRQVYRSISACCESGWDFSVRWFKDFQNMETICTERIAPVDLNSYLGWNEKLLAKFYGLLGMSEKVAYYTQRYNDRVEAISDVMWNEEKGCWFDVDIEDKSQREAFFLSNFTPLFTGCYEEIKTDHLVSNVLGYLKCSGALNYKGGIPNSMTTYGGQQWDFPSSWPPSVHMLIEGLSSTGVPEAENMARELAQTWLQCNYTGWKKHGAMFEKYCVLEPGSPGGGGEYSVQKGFGWTNAVVLILMDKYRDQVTLHTPQI